MSSNSKIEWTDATWNPITGCSPISEGCESCYARRMATRLRGRCGYDMVNPFSIMFHPDRLGDPARWRNPRRIFVCSMGDLFHHDVPEDLIDCVFARMALSPKHTFIVLTKRPGRALAYFERIFELRNLGDIEISFGASSEDYLLSTEDEERLRKPLVWPLPNVWIGVTAENQQRANERIPVLMQIPAAVRFVSVEPMLGPVDLRRVIFPHGGIENVLCCEVSDMARASGIEKLNGIDWVICGGETGYRSRVMQCEWVSSLSEQCEQEEIPFFFKNWGSATRKVSGDPVANIERREFPTGAMK